MSGATRPNVRMSAQYNFSGADITLVCSDNMLFCVHRKNLAAKSSMFRDMFDTVMDVPEHKPLRSQVSTVEVTESSDVLAAILPYFYDGTVPKLALKFPASWEIVKAADKYDIKVLLDAFENKLRRQVPKAVERHKTHPCEEPESRSGMYTLCSAAVFAHHFALTDLYRDALRALVPLELYFVHGVLKRVVRFFSSMDRVTPIYLTLMKYRDLVTTAHQRLRQVYDDLYSLRDYHVRHGPGYGQLLCKEEFGTGALAFYWTEANATFKTAAQMKEYADRINGVFKCSECRRTWQKVTDCLVGIMRTSEVFEDPTIER